MKRGRSGLALLLALAAAGCGIEVVVGGQKDVYATGDGTAESGGSTSLLPGWEEAAEPPAGRLEGTVTFDARVLLVGPDGAEPVNGPAQATLRLDGRDTLRVLRDRPEAREYGAVRVTFFRVQAQVTGGLEVGGISVTGEVRVDIPIEDGLVVERSVDLGAPADSVAVLVDLDVSAWLAAVDPVTKTVPADAFVRAVQVRRLR
ncbi:MAG TPA: hypothetical protein VFX98_17170 [Longimicrobiaceae bacterium]|nr:hypothetical protein [Longimicrobiaceae bacterium]